MPPTGGYTLVGADASFARKIIVPFEFAGMITPVPAGDEVISVVVVVDSVENKVVAGPEIHARGFSENDEVFDAVIPLIKINLEQAMNDNVYGINQLQKVVRRTTGKWVSDQHRRRPMIIPVVVEA